MNDDVQIHLLYLNLSFFHFYWKMFTYAIFKKDLVEDNQFSSLKPFPAGNWT